MNDSEPTKIVCPLCKVLGTPEFFGVKGNEAFCPRCTIGFTIGDDRQEETNKCT